MSLYEVLLTAHRLSSQAQAGTEPIRTPLHIAGRISRTQLLRLLCIGILDVGQDIGSNIRRRRHGESNGEPRRRAIDRSSRIRSSRRPGSCSQAICLLRRTALRSTVGNERRECKQSVPPVEPSHLARPRYVPKHLLEVGEGRRGE